MPSVRRLTRLAQDRLPDRVSDSARQVATGWGRLTSGIRLEPTFLVVGAQRCGTTTLYRMLSEHPQVVRPTTSKGIGYFDLEYTRSFNWYRGHFPVEALAKRRTAPVPPRHLREQRVLLLPPGGGGTDRPRPPGGEGGHAGPRPGGTCVVGLQARVGPRVRARDVRAGTRARAQSTRRRGGAAGCRSRLSGRGPPAPLLPDTGPVRRPARAPAGTHWGRTTCTSWTPGGCSSIPVRSSPR